MLDAQFHAPVSRAKDDKRASADIPKEEKKSFDWIHALRDCVALVGAGLNLSSFSRSERACFS